MARWAYAVLAVEITAVVVFSLFYDSLDFHIYWEGGRVVTQGTRLYRERLVGLWYTNTPFLGAAFVPLAALPLTLARPIWQVGAVAAFAWACASTLRLAGRRVTRTNLAAAVAAGLLLEPVWHSFFLGQVNILLMALVLADFRRGAGIGIAAAIKLTPAIFVVLLLATGRIRAAVTATAAFLICTGLAFAVAPDASWLYWRDVFYDTTRVGIPYISNQSPYGAAVRIMHGDVGAWFGAVPPLLGAAGIAVAARWARRGDRLAAVAVTGVTGLLVSPVSWAHHWVWVVPALAVLLRDGAYRLAFAGYALFVLAVPWWTPHGGGPSEYGFHGVPTLAANAYLAAGPLFVGYMAARLRSPRPAGRRDRGRGNGGRAQARAHAAGAGAHEGHGVTTGGLTTGAFTAGARTRPRAPGVMTTRAPRHVRHSGPVAEGGRHAAAGVWISIVSVMTGSRMPHTADIVAE
ncbi:glycosyltransferase 87 family protein [Actinomadura atramentaria]|uniref:glycosyltransferase 87 family protein n=1 Tax=Actinomadura atramentaria TaxID=1990 RepID=UPI0003640F24|nr:glycosyltransferase 87 family protein [Actinomadura atramentaria]